METALIAFGATLIIATGAGMVIALIYPLIRPGLLKREPRQRANALLGWAAAPLGVGLFFTSLIVMPSLLDRLGIPAGHYHNHGRRLPHICLTHPLLPGPETIPWYVVAVPMFILAGFLAFQGRHWHKVSQLKAALCSIGCESEAAYKLIPWQKPVALTVGFRAPKIFISKTLVQALSPEQLQVVITHEQGHVRRRDPLRRYWVRLLSHFHLSQTRRSILADWALASEQACDEEAALKTGDRLQVAETIVAVERLLQDSQMGGDALAVGFTNSHSALRIESLLAGGQYQEPLCPGRFLFLAPLAVTAMIMPGPVHYLAELVISH